MEAVDYEWLLFAISKADKIEKIFHRISHKFEEWKEQKKKNLAHTWDI